MDKKISLLWVGGIVILLIVLAVLWWPNNNQPTENQPPSGNEGIQITFPAPNATVSAPLKISGFIKGNGWSAFEGQTGTVKLFDSTGKELALGILTATEDWMQAEVDFETTLYFDYPGDGMGNLVFYNENASGEAERNRTFELPVKLAKSSGEKITVKAYFNNSAMDPAYTCEKVFPINRDIPKTEGVARVALEVLIIGLTDLEKNAGFITNINSGTKIQSLTIENGVAKVDFNDELGKNAAGSCKVTAIRSQIEQTLKQFSTVKSVVISINGKTEDILQP